MKIEDLLWFFLILLMLEHFYGWANWSLDQLQKRDPEEMKGNQTNWDWNEEN